MKEFLQKTTWKTNHCRKEFEEIILDMDITLKNISLLQVEEDIQILVLKPNSLLNGQILISPYEDQDEDVPEIKWCQQYIYKCRDTDRKVGQRNILEPYKKEIKFYVKQEKCRYQWWHRFNQSWWKTQGQNMISWKVRR